jgi:hypothetical protein
MAMEQYFLQINLFLENYKEYYEMGYDKYEI